jgi:hypothetical protein
MSCTIVDNSSNTVIHSLSRAGQQRPGLSPQCWKHNNMSGEVLDRSIDQRHAHEDSANGEATCPQSKLACIEVSLPGVVVLSQIVLVASVVTENDWYTTYQGSQKQNERARGWFSVYVWMAVRVSCSVGFTTGSHHRPHLLRYLHAQSLL